MIPMMESFQNIVTYAIYGYNLAVHEESSALVFGVVTSTLAESLLDYHFKVTS